MATKYTNRVKATVWTPTMRSEFTSSIKESIPYIFFGVANRNDRADVIAKLQRIDRELTAREDAQAARTAENRMASAKKVTLPDGRVVYTTQGDEV